MFSIIAAIGKNNELGKDNKLIFKIKDDMTFFKEKTSGHKIVMGHKTWDSLPGKLKNRENIVISSHDFPGPDQIIHDLGAFIQANQNTDEEIYIIGGGTVYFQFLPYAQNIYLTEINQSEKDATTFFPEFDKTKYNQTLIKKGSENGLNYQIIRYTVKNLK